MFFFCAYSMIRKTIRKNHVGWLCAVFRKAFPGGFFYFEADIFGRGPMGSCHVVLRPDRLPEKNG
jgi:hypothetical protein